MQDCKCFLEHEFGHTAVESGSMWIYDTMGDFVMDFEINYCPFCGKKIREEEK